MPNSSGVYVFEGADLACSPELHEANDTEAIPKGSPAPASAELVKNSRLFMILFLI
jgi:hypothetical protein